MKRSTISLALLAVLVMGSQAVGQKPPTPHDLLKVNLPEATKMLDANPKLVNARDGNSDTALILASREGNVELVQLLLSKGADPNIHGEYGRTALHMAVASRSTKIIRLLLSKKASINETDDLGLTPLYYSASAKQLPAVMLLISSGAEVTIIEAAAMEDSEKVESMVKANPKLACVKTKSGVNPLFLAVKADNFELVKLLLSNGADVKAKATTHAWGIDDWESDLTPLHAAVQNQNLVIAKLLMAKGADPNAASGGYEVQGITPLHMATENNDMDMVTFLISQKADVNAVGYYEIAATTPLLSAVANNNLEMVKLLFSKGAKTNVKSDGVTLLQSAKEIGNKQMIELLKKCGAK